MSGFALPALSRVVGAWGFLRSGPDRPRASPRRMSRAVAAEHSLIDQSGLFDAVWYLERNPEAADQPDPILHYVTRGAAAGLAPHPLFDVAWYVRHHPEARRRHTTPLGHFIRTGEAAGATPHPLFDPAWYRRQDAALAGLQTGLFRHYLHEGALAGLSPHPAFNVAWYHRVRPDVERGRINPLTHFASVGRAERISPNPFFDAEFYLADNPDVAASGANPLVHYLSVGASAGRRPHPLVELSKYRDATPECPEDPEQAYLFLTTHETAKTYFSPASPWLRDNIAWRVQQLGLFDPQVYCRLHGDLHGHEHSALTHFVEYGFREARAFTNCNVVARRLGELAPDLAASADAFAADARASIGGGDARGIAALLRARDIRIGIFCSSEGNFFMREVADLTALGLRALGIRTELRDETDRQDEPFDLRIFVAPHEFFYLGRGRSWTALSAAHGSVMYNVEQMQTQWFCRAFTHMIEAPLVLDINFQTAEVMRRAGCNTVHFMPGYLRTAAYAKPVVDISGVELTRGYRFARTRFDWTEYDDLADRPIDILFIGSSAPRRARLLPKLLELGDQYRFMCICTTQDVPLTSKNYQSTTNAINCALAQRSKIVLNVHRDWVGYFEWSRMVLQGFWQGACVVTDPSMPHPLYQPGVHYLEDNAAHLSELMRWLLGSRDGRDKLQTTRLAALRQTRSLGSMEVALTPVLQAFRQHLKL